MFTNKSVLVLVASAIVATTVFWFLDNEPGSDGIVAFIMLTVMVFILITIVYAIVYSAQKTS